MTLQTKQRIAIHAHVFYPELWAELSCCIRNFPQDSTDIFITYPDTLPISTEEMLKADFPSAKVYRLENRGYDIGPFVKVVHELNLDAYDIVVKLHTKRNRRAIVKFLPYWGGIWRRKLLAFCSTPKAVQRTLSVFKEKAQVGMVGHGDLIMHVSDELVPGAANTPQEQDYSFVAGTMFAVRAKLLKSIRTKISFTDFPLMQGRTNSDLAWIWERKFGNVVKLHRTTIYALPQSSIFSRILHKHLKCLYMAYCTVLKRA